MRRTPFLLVAAATIGLLALGAAPANAADPRTVPEGDTLFGIACPYYSTPDAKLPAMQLIKLDAATAVGTLVGPGTPALTDTDCGGQGAWNAVTSKAYSIAQNMSGAETSALVTIDPVSGVSTLISEFKDGADVVLVSSIAISPDGVAYAAGEDSGGDGFLYTLNLDTAAVVKVGEFDDQYTMSFDPTSGVLYSLDSDGEIFTVDTTTAAALPAGQLPQSGIYSFAIDSAGIIWYGVDLNVPGGYQSELFSVDRTALDTSAVSSGFITVDGTRPYPEALLLVPAAKPTPEPDPVPVLAATGGVVNGSLVAGGAVLALLGFGMVAFRRRRTA